VAELAVCGLPSILIPYPYATGRHQEANARALQRAGGATMLLDDELDGRVLAERIAWLLDHEDRLARMARGALGWARPDAADALADVVVAAGGGP
jgi:UDP-N-acetylglucosamine--N-acetylmuramyl-(pentapeptide) pyrophosphoryl-undecaprenol N-acetylglucosamine transferase